jgi:hypothetical protein
MSYPGVCDTLAMGCDPPDRKKDIRDCERGVLPRHFNHPSVLSSLRLDHPAPHEGSIFGWLMNRSYRN